MPFLSSSRIADLLHCATVNPANFVSITTDTRELKPGDLFVALLGESQDGHKFIPQALAKGAGGIIHGKNFAWDKSNSAISFPVDNTLEAYAILAHAWRKLFSYPVLAVAGSAGKTTSKEFLAAILRGKFQSVHQTLASQNGFTGIPATLLKLKAEHQAAVIEVGIDEPGAMEQHLKVVSPDGGLLTSIGPEHLEKLIDLETVAHEEGKIFEDLESRAGIIAVNLDDPYIAKAAKNLKRAKIFTYGLSSSAAKFHGRVEDREGMEQLVVTGFSSSEEAFALPMEGTHNALNLLGALTLAYAVGVSPTEMRAGLKKLVPPPGRSEVHSWRGTKVYADTYNANPASVNAALEMLMKQAAVGSASWVCLADMLELGTFEEKLHRSLAAPLTSFKIQHVFLFGERMRWLADELQSTKFPGEVRHFDNLENLTSELGKRAQTGDRILLKGSRGMRMERVWEQLAKQA